MEKASSGSRVSNYWKRFRILAPAHQEVSEGSIGDTKPENDDGEEEAKIKTKDPSKLNKTGEGPGEEEVNS